jgi:MFS family permease
MNAHHWMVLAFAWVGWGLDVFDGLLFNYVAPNCVPTLLRLPIGSPIAKAAVLEWTSILTALLLVGWALGGILFGQLADRLGRSRTLVLTMVLYAVGTAAGAFAPNIWVLLFFRILTGLGIGGEWAAGAAMVAEVVPENRRVVAGALLFTASPFGISLAARVNYLIAGGHSSLRPESSWRYVLLAGAFPAIVALVLRLFLREPERWRAAVTERGRPSLRELFHPENRARTRSGLVVSLLALIAYWSCNTFIPSISANLAQLHAVMHSLAGPAAAALAEEWKLRATNYFNLGGLLGALLTIPIAQILGRRWMFALYFLGSALAMLATFGLSIEPSARLLLYGPLGLAVYGLGGSFTFYLPELFPTRLRGTGAGFCYNAGRLFAAAGTLFVGSIAARGPDALRSILAVLVWISLVPLAGLFILPWIVETRGQSLPE